MRVRFAVVAAAGLSLLAAGASAHHSGAMFERSKTLVLEGVVKSYAYTMPHSWVDLNVTPAGGGEPVSWGIECGTPPAMRGPGRGGPGAGIPGPGAGTARLVTQRHCTAGPGMAG